MAADGREHPRVLGLRHAARGEQRTGVVGREVPQGHDP
jgi:hypothetical protein